MGLSTGQKVVGFFLVLGLVITGLYFAGFLDDIPSLFNSSSKAEDGGSVKDTDAVVDDAPKVQNLDAVIKAKTEITDEDQDVLKRLKERAAQGNAGSKHPSQTTTTTKTPETQTVKTNDTTKNKTDETGKTGDISTVNPANVKDVKPAQEEVQPKPKPLPKWTPNASLIKPTPIGQLALKGFSLIIDFYNVKSDEDLKSLTKKTRHFVQGVFGNVKTFLKKNYGVVALIEPKLSLVLPPLRNTGVDTIVDLKMKTVLAEITPQAIVDATPQIKQFSKQVFSLVFPLVFPLDSFAGLQIPSDKDLNDALKVIHALIFLGKLEKNSCSSNALEAVKTAVRSPAFFNALAKIYAETDFALLVASETSEEFFTTLKAFMGSPKHYPLLPLLLSISEEPAVRATSKLLKKLLVGDAKYASILKTLKKAVGMVPVFTFDKDIMSDINALVKEFKVIEADTGLEGRTQKVFAETNVQKCGMEVFGQEFAQNMVLLPDCIRTQKGFDELVRLIKKFAALDALEKVPALIQNSVKDFANTGITVTFLLQIIIRLN